MRLTDLVNIVTRTKAKHRSDAYVYGIHILGMLIHRLPAIWIGEEVHPSSRPDVQQQLRGSTEGRDQELRESDGLYRSKEGIGIREGKWAESNENDEG